MLFYKMNKANIPVKTKRISTKPILPKRRLSSRNRNPNPTYFGPDYINPGTDINAIIGKLRAQNCDEETIATVQQAYRDANNMENMDVDAIINAMNNMTVGGGKKKKGGTPMLFLPLAILMAKDINKAINVISRLVDQYGSAYLNSWFTYINELHECLKYFYNDTMIHVYPYLLSMYESLPMSERLKREVDQMSDTATNVIAPFIIEYGPIYFNYIIKLLGDLENGINKIIDDDKRAKLNLQIQDMQKHFQELKENAEKEKKQELQRIAKATDVTTKTTIESDEAIAKQKRENAIVGEIVIEAKKKLNTLRNTAKNLQKAGEENQMLRAELDTILQATANIESGASEKEAPMDETSGGKKHHKTKKHHKRKSNKKHGKKKTKTSKRR